MAFCVILVRVKVFTVTQNQCDFISLKNHFDLFLFLLSSPTKLASFLMSLPTSDLCSHVPFARNVLYSDNHMTHSLIFFRSLLLCSLTEIFSDQSIQNCSPQHCFYSHILFILLFPSQPSSSNIIRITNIHFISGPLECRFHCF